MLRAAASLELLHASALVHDDLMDASDTRRGRPATHRGFAALHREQAWPGDPDQYGAAAAILLGDLLLSWSDELLRRCGLPWDRVDPALAVLDHCRSEVIAGQFLDVSVQARGRATVDAAMTVLRYKSAKYSIERPLHVGAALAGADAATLTALTSFGLPLGEAFQLRDDLLGVFGDPATTGKPAGDDLVEGKRTVLVALALESAPAPEAARLDAALGTALDPATVAELRGIIDRSGAHAQVEAKIDDLARQAVTALAEARTAVGLDEHACAVLEGLAASATRRVLWGGRGGGRGGHAELVARSVQRLHAGVVGTGPAQQHLERRVALVVVTAEHGAERLERLRLGPGEGAPSLPEEHRGRGQVAQAVAQPVDVGAVVVREVERGADRAEHLRLGLQRDAVDVPELPARVLDRVLHVGDVEGCVPQMDAGVVPTCEYGRQAAHGWFISRSPRTTRSGLRLYSRSYQIASA
ncbi:polyprenyl synthetase family protein [Nocardioides pelophilus]|uniref:polyprenyl synthetase family protein n=1 Tax=Nocardioides pelophilus TaxID=2172019 RepID=UPI0028A58CCD|nr:polyprenyl synthetase family protein [Nocardioides pelophilus]